MRPLSEKRADIAAFISNCGAKSIRLEALEMLNKTLNVDSFGRCMHNADTSERKIHALLRYKFSLAFENSQVHSHGAPNHVNLPTCKPFV